AYNGKYALMGTGRCGPPGAYWSKARVKVGVTAVEATHIIGLGARQGDLHDQCNYPQRQNRPEQPGLRHLGNAFCEHEVLVFHKLISFSCFGLPWLPTAGGRFRPFTEVLRKIFGSLTRKFASPALNR